MSENDRMAPVGQTQAVVNQSSLSIFYPLTLAGGYLLETFDGLAVVPDGKKWISTDSNRAYDHMGETLFFSLKTKSKPNLGMRLPHRCGLVSFLACIRSAHQFDAQPRYINRRFGNDTGSSSLATSRYQTPTDHSKPQCNLRVTRAPPVQSVEAQRRSRLQPIA